MATFTLPKTLVAGTNENVNDVQSNFTSLLGNLNTDFEPAFSSYKVVEAASCGLDAFSITGAGTYVISGNGGSVGLASASTASVGVFYLDPANWAASSRTTKYRVLAELPTKGTAPGQTSTFGLYPVSATSGGAVTLGTVTSGSTVAIASNTNTLNQGNSGDFTAPAAGFYAFAVVSAGAWTGGSSAVCKLRLLMRQV